MYTRAQHNPPPPTPPSKNNRFAKRGIDSGKVAVSLAESTVFRKLAKPVTIPAKLWLTWKFVQATDMRQNISSSPSPSSSPSSSPLDDQQKPENEGNGPWGRLRLLTRRNSDEPGGTQASNRRGVGVGGLPQRAKGARAQGLGLGAGAGARTRAGERGGRRRRKAVCSPFGGGGGPGCFVVSVRRPVCVTAVNSVTVRSGRSLGDGLRAYRVPATIW